MSYRHATLAELLESRTLLSATLVKDINTTQAAASGLSEMIWAGDVAYLSQRDNAHGGELWKSDGTAGGTSLVLDILPGKASASPSLITPVGAAGNVFFTADDGVGGRELWRSDGTAGGTSRVLDINPGAASSNPANLTNVNGTLYFTADDGVNGAELWKSDGTPGGTSMVVDLNTGPNNSSSPFNLFNFNGTLLFSTTSASGTLYRTDGTANGTSSILAAAGGPRNAASFTLFNGDLYFIANDNTASTALWKSDGTAANTSKVYTHSTLKSLMKAGSLMYFVDTTQGTNGVYRSNGTTAGTAKVSTSQETVFAMADLNGMLIYKGGPFGATVMKSTGGNSSAISTSTMANSGFTVVNGFAYFEGLASGMAYELYRTDGTTISLVKDINPGTPGGTPSFLTPIGATGEFLMNANDGTTGGALMRSAGTAATTTNVKDINDATATSYPRQFASLNGDMFFNAMDGVSSGGTISDFTSGELWTSDGTAGGTHLLADIAPGIAPSGPVYLTTLGNKIIFTATDGVHGRELWTTDGTAAGTSMLVDLLPGTGDGAGGRLYHFGNSVYFVATTGSGTGSVGVWRSDGTAGGTVRLTPNTTNVNPNRFAEANGHVFFLDSTNGQLWASDGTAGTTSVVLSGANFGGWMESAGSRVVFSATAPGMGGEIWSSDGTVGGTTFVKDIFPGSQSSVPNRFVSVDGAVLFIANDGNGAGSHGPEMWRSDGTTAGTYLLKDINPGQSGSVSLGNFINVNGVAYFLADDGQHGVEPWRSDGTAAGTRLLKDINPGPGTSNPQVFWNVNGYVCFDATDGTIGDEGWISDGTTAGTVSLGDIYPGASGGVPLEFFGFGDGIYFNVEDPNNGRELYRIDVPTFATLTSGTLTITGTDHNDTLHVAQPGDGTLRIDFNGYQRSYALGDVSSIVFNGNDASDTLVFDSTVAAPVSFVGGSGIQHTVNVNAGTRTFASDLGDIGPSVNLNVAAGASAVFGASQHLVALNVNGAAQLSAGGSKLLNVGSLSIGSTGQLDLTDNDLLATSTPKASIENYIAAAYNFGGWDGTHGLFSSTARDNPNGNTTLGNLSGDEFNNNNGGVFNGVTPNTNDVLVKYTYFGDVDFNGSVDVSDYNLIDFGFSNHLTGWGFGDADYSGAVDVSDYNLIDFAFTTQTQIL